MVRPLGHPAVRGGSVCIFPYMIGALFLPVQPLKALIIYSMKLWDNCGRFEKGDLRF